MPTTAMTHKSLLSHIVEEVNILKVMMQSTRTKATKHRTTLLEELSFAHRLLDGQRVLSLGGSTVTTSLPSASEDRPQGMHMFFTVSGDILVDYKDLYGWKVRELTTVPPEVIAGSFAVQDLEAVLRELHRVHATVRNWQIAYGHSRLIQWLIDHLSSGKTT